MLRLLRACPWPAAGRSSSHRRRPRRPSEQSSPALTLSMSEPHLQYPARRDRRRVVCHAGPTNSGKTFAALKAMAAATSGVYCGPLRLLAWEVSETLRQRGVPCSLVTGQERDLVSDDGESAFVSCTIEMLDLGRHVEVGVIDECQMIGDTQRGWAWTRALLGMRASEVHVCGSAAMLELVRKLCDLTGDELSVVRYERLSPLTIGERALGSYKHIRKGDCVVGFSRQILYQIKNQIERADRALKCCIIYGNLPPATRKEQTRLFNAPDSAYDVLVATDAIGMGLNLSIRRLIFSALDKFDGQERRPLSAKEVKQIGGRAGRYGSRFEKGEVLTLHQDDMPALRASLCAADVSVRKAGLAPSREQLEVVGVLLDSGVRDQQLSAFWAEQPRALDFDFDADEGAGEGRLTVGHVLQRFSSAALFARKLASFMDRRLGHSSEEYCPHRGPRTPLSRIYSALRRDAQTEDLYFLCDLDESVERARAIDGVAVSFGDRVLFCNAPVLADDEEMRSAFERYCDLYAAGEEVPVGVDVEVYERTPTSVDALFQLECLHKVLDLYLWLGYHFPASFTRVEEAAAMAARSSLLIHAGIQLVGSAYQTERARRLKIKEEKREKKKNARRASKGRRRTSTELL